MSESEQFQLEPSAADRAEPRILTYSLGINLKELARAAELGLDPDMLINSEVEQLSVRAKIAVKFTITDAVSIAERWKGK